MENTFDFDKFFSDLKTEEKTTKRRESESTRINKIYSKYPAHQGTIYCVPFSTKSGNPFIAIEGVMTAKINVDGRDTSMKLLPKSFLNIVDGSPEDILYGELVSLHRNLFDNKGTKYGLAKYENVYLMYAWVLRHSDVNSQMISEKIPSLLVMSNRKFKDAFLDASKQMINLVGNTSWASKWYSRELTRQGIVKISFKLDQNQYSFGYSNEQITPMMHGLTDGKGTVTVSQDVVETYFDDPVNDYLGVDKIEERFDIGWYQKVKVALQNELSKLNQGII